MCEIFSLIGSSIRESSGITSSVATPTGIGIAMPKENIPSIYDFIKSKKLQDDYNDEMVRQTWKYQKKYGFETKNEPKQEFWNVEADAFKHTFGSADLYFKYGDFGSLSGGIYHEWKQHKNPQGEWNMDSWNNNQGREIAKEMSKEYDLSKLSTEQRNDILADKIMQRMRSGQIITHPNDNRVYKGSIEKNVFSIQNFLEAKGIKKP